MSIGYSSLTFFGPCPHCGNPLFELSDMWGPFYACEDCGYEFSPLVVAPNRRQPQHEPAFAGSFGPNDDNGSQQLLHATSQAQDPGRCLPDNPRGDTIPGVTHLPERDRVASPGNYRTAPAFGR
jgi:hypothetical protein